MSILGQRLRKLRGALAESSSNYSLRKVAGRVGVSPAWLSRVETGDADYDPSAEVITALAEDLGEDPDVLLAMAGRTSNRLQQIICRRPELFAQILEELDQLPDHAIVRIVREVRDGDW
jgi:transcriptional regulator with XRE-family HTH domain